MQIRVSQTARLTTHVLLIQVGKLIGGEEFVCRNIVITRNASWQYPGVTVAHDLNEAIAAAETDTVFIIGGAQIYELALPLVDVLHLTRIHARWASADVYFPALNMDEWQEVSREHHESDHRNAYEFDFITLKRRSQ